MSVAATESTAPIVLPWGETEQLQLQIPPAWPILDVVRPDLAGPIDDYPAALRKALDAPGGAPPFEHELKAGSTVAVVVDDPSRWTPVREALPIVLKRLHDAGVRRGDVRIVAG